MTRPQKITFGEMRSTGVRGVLIYCSDYKCSHCLITSGFPISSPVSPAQACGKKGADVRPDFHWNKPPVAAMGYR